MAISKTFMTAVDSGSSKESIRGRICRSLHSDPTGNEFYEMLDYAKKRVPDLIDAKHVGDLKASGWSKDYLGEQIAESQYNFSDERIKHVIEVAHVVYSDKLPNKDKPGDEKMPGSAHKSWEKPPIVLPPETPARNRKKALGTGVAVAGVAVGVTGVVVASNELVIAGAICLVAGLAIALTE